MRDCETGAISDDEAGALRDGDAEVDPADSSLREPSEKKAKKRRSSNVNSKFANLNSYRSWGRRVAE